MIPKFSNKQEVNKDSTIDNTESNDILNVISIFISVFFGILGIIFYIFR